MIRFDKLNTTKQELELIHKIALRAIAMIEEHAETMEWANQ